MTPHDPQHPHAWNMYARFAAMVTASAVAMYGVMYLNTYVLADVRFSEMRVYMALLMVAVMAPIMLLFMRGMYRSRTANAVILAGSAALFLAALWLVRTQGTVDDVSYMKAMIPHHSIAILTSSRARLSDPRVRELAARIAETQRREIAEMEALITELEARR